MKTSSPISTPLPYLKKGSSKLPPLVFLHGFLGCKEDWLPVIDHLENHFCCYALDLPEHGQEDEKCSNSLVHYKDLYQDTLQRIRATLTALTLLQAPLIGYSLGGRIALQYRLSTLPYALDKIPLILISSHLGLEKKEERQKRKEQDEKWAELLENAPWEEFLREWYNQPIFAPLRAQPAVFSAMMQRRLLGASLLKASFLRSWSLAKLPCTKTLPPFTLCMYGKEDSRYATLYAKLPAQEKQEIVHSGHVIPLEAPQECAQTIHRFITGCYEQITASMDRAP